MFGISFTEFFIIAVVAVIALGPEKLPKAMVEIAKFFKFFTKAMNDAKDSDIARVKIPKMLENFLGFKPKISYCVGNDFSDNLKIFKLIIHCGACMLNRKAMISRIKNVKDAGVAITNYGITISVCKNDWSAQKRHFLIFNFHILLSTH